VELYVIPGAKTSYLALRDNEILFYSSASCKRHGVNMDLVRYLTRHIGYKPVIARGWSARKKVVVFKGVEKQVLLDKLENILSKERKK
jgi:uncharacterized protein YggU (UPF0235/DUF167 family)